MAYIPTPSVTARIGNKDIRKSNKMKGIINSGVPVIKPVQKLNKLPVEKHTNLNLAYRTEYLKKLSRHRVPNYSQTEIKERLENGNR